ncbi:Gfo/Idh/MocA family oxidoreductase [Arthrobacter deserti]|uniref:Gfo/Idh/MocA family oxidoreductase n=1 Tax=Arthrobacter deserti TaxID=1742687 RepID=A0ABX1JQX4_9MICC|nr:Gfo/Idh/MocA family oxidoreductase [Arthrobacter deserti]
MTNGSIGWGILGTGFIAELFVRDLVMEGPRVAAVGPRSGAAAQTFAGSFGIPAAHSSYGALVADPAVDIVYVASPHPFHAEHALLALRAGKHVLVEKPFTLNAGQAREVVAEARSRGLLVLEAMWTRFLPHMARVREIVAQGRIGQVRTVIADHGQLLPAEAEHRVNNPALGGGALLDLGIYPVSLAVDLLGVPRQVHAISTAAATGVDAQTSLLLQGADGSHAVLQCALDALGPTRASIIGSRGRIEIPGVWYEPSSLEVFDDAGGVVERWDGPVAGRGMQFQAFEAERCPRAGLTASSLLPPDETIRIMEVLDAAREQIGLVYPQEQPAGQ